MMADKGKYLSIRNASMSGNTMDHFPNIKILPSVSHD